MSALCPCGSQNPYLECCGPYIEGGQLAPTPEKLMRSRYVAFTQGAWDYLKKTWHPETVPDDLGVDEPSQWVGLTVIEASEEGDEGEVEFEARLIFDDKLEVLHEISDFEKVEGAWLYHSGEFLNDHKPQKISRGQPCPCGSGKKYAQCHAQR